MNKLFLILCFLSLGAMAQTDSLTIKLKSLKALKDSNLITQSEYDQLRLKELNLKPKSNSVVQTKESVKRLKQNIQTKKVGVGAGLILGGVSIWTSYYFKNKPIPIKFDAKGKVDQAAYDANVSSNIARSKAFAVLSGCMGVFAILNGATLPNAIDRYERAKQSTSIYFNPNGLTFAYKF